MKIGVIADVHSNIYALDAALDALKKRGAEAIACVGDIIGIGARPEECVGRLMALENLAVCVRGNHEEYFIGGIPARMTGEEAAFHAWEHSLLSAASRAFLRSLPLSASFCGAYFTHYPRAGGEFLPIGAHALLKEESASPAIFFGHDHRRGVFRENGRLLCDPGALGCPGASSAARAAIYDSATGDIGLVDAEYDADAAAREIFALGRPAHRTILEYFYGGRCL